MTTIDVDIQDICERVLREQLEYLVETSNGQTQEGVVIVLETATGDIKAMTSLSRNPDNSFSENQPLAVGNMYEPGSVFKPMSFLVAMDDGKMNLKSSVDVGNGVRTMYRRFMRDHNWRRGTGYGLITAPEIIKYSSNIGVSVIIDEAYKDDPARFVDGLYRLGVAEDLKIPLDHYHKPFIRRPTKENWSKTALPWMSIGYETQVPPISTVNFYAGVANNGKMFRPRLIKALLRDGQIVKEFPNEVLREQMERPEAIKMIQHCLYEVVHTGLGRRAGSKMFDVSGKTGTAQIWTKAGKSQEYLISFAGYFPSQKPRYACIVCIRKSGTASGGGMCGPVFSKVAESIMAKAHQSDFSSARDTVNSFHPEIKAGDIEASRQVLKQFGISHQAHFNEFAGETVWGNADAGNGIVSLSPNEAPKDSIPDVCGYGLRDALFHLESLGLKVNVKGAGVVTYQSRKPGTSVKPGDSITIMLASSPKTTKK
jgi:cell division protein FtsI (penicillin-binding protein 3)